MGRKSSILIGLGWLAIIIIVYPYVKPVLEDIATTVLTTTGITSGFAHYVINSMPFWGLLVGIAGAMMIIIFGGKEND